MARSRYTPKRVYKYAKQKWCPNIKSGQVQLDTTNQAAVLNLLVNSTDTATPTPVVIKAKHFKLQMDVRAIQNNTSQYTYPLGIYGGIIYVPEGINIVTKDNITALIASHPEWVIIHTLLDSAESSGSMIQRTSSLSRNLNSGDRIVMYCYASTWPQGSANTTHLDYNVSWVNRAN